MKKLLFSFLLLSLFAATGVQAQFRSERATPYNYSGPIVNQQAPTVQNGLERFFNSIDMSHSYSMSFGSYGGSYQSMNAYTNTMQFMITPNLHGRVDVSFLHSPFGGNAFSQYGGVDNQIIIQNAELNYRISDKASIHIQYNQLPSGYGYGYGYNPFGYGYGYSRYQRYPYSDFGYW